MVEKGEQLEKVAIICYGRTSKLGRNWIEERIVMQNKMTKAGPGTLEPYPSELMEKRRQANPREDPFTSPDNTAYG